MDIERLAQKLAPLLPEEVKRWRRLRDTGDPELVPLLDQQLARLAYKHLGDFRTKILLSLPPEKLIQGEFSLGRILYEQEKWEAGLKRSELL